MSFSSVSPSDFKNLMSHWATGVAFATVMDKSGTGEPHGLVISSLAAVSADPAQLLFSVGNNVFARQHFDASTYIGLHLLSHDQQWLSAQMTKAFTPTPEQPKPLRWEGVDWFQDPETKVPLLDRALRRSILRVHQRIEAGDHHIILCDVIKTLDDNPAKDSLPLVYYHRDYHNLEK